MRHAAIVRLAVLAALSCHGVASLQGTARAAEIVNPPLIYPPDTWQGRSSATIRVLDTLDSHVQVLTVPVGQDATYKALTIHVGACRDRPATLAPDAAAWVSVRDARQDGPGFDGWMLAQEPFLGVFQDPVYTVQLTGCDGATTAPTPPPLTPPVTADATSAPGTGAAPGATPNTAPGAAPPGAAPPSAAPTAAAPPNIPPSATPSVATPPTTPPAAVPSPAAAAPARPAAPAPGGQPLSLVPPDEGDTSPPPSMPVASQPSSMPVAPPAIAGQHQALPPPTPYQAGTDGGGGSGKGAPLSLLPPPTPDTPQDQPAAPQPGPDQPQPGQPQSLLPR